MCDSVIEQIEITHSVSGCFRENSLNSDSLSSEKSEENTHKS